MNKSQAQSSLKKISTEVVKLDPSSLVTLYEVDTREIATALSLKVTGLDVPANPFRFHNMSNLKGISIEFQGEDYYSFPIIADGFEMNSTGTLPTPTLTIAPVEGMEESSAFSLLKSNFISYENLIGAKVSRIRTFAKFLDANQEIEGVGDEADSNAEFPREVYFIERKSNEDKYSVQFELSSVLDLDNLKLPGRVIFSTKCPWRYRGEGCCYEYLAAHQGPTSGDNQTQTFGATGHLPDFAPPVANADNKMISGTVTGANGASAYNPDTLGKVTGTNSFSGAYLTGSTYNTGDVIFLERDSIKYYFVAKTGTFTNVCPPHSTYWEPDQCSKTLVGCKLRWGTAGKAKSCADAGCSTSTGTNEFLPFGGFPGTNTRTSIN